MKLNYEQKIDRIISLKFSTKLMNDTKWRELFTCLARLYLAFKVAYIDDENLLLSEKSYYISTDLIGDRGIKDPGIGSAGFCLYKQIYCICINRIPHIPKTPSEQKYLYYQRQQNNFNELLKELDKLGQIPINLLDDRLEIHGYICSDLAFGEALRDRTTI
jgi:hypothetical protein